MVIWPLTRLEVHLTGTLSGDGTDMVPTVVYTDLIGEPSPELHGLLNPVCDPIGAVCDWRVSPIQAQISAWVATMSITVVSRVRIPQVKRSSVIQKGDLPFGVGVHEFGGLAGRRYRGLVAAGTGIRTHRTTR